MAALGNQIASPIQYTAKPRNPCQRPKSLRVQRYSPPVPGYFTESVPTATASGTMNSTAARNHSVTLPGPACAAAGIQRVPTMHAMANSVMSRRPSSRFSSLCMRALRRRFPLGVKLDPDAAQALVQKLRLAAQPDADIALQTEVRAGHDQHALLRAHALAQLEARRRRVVLHQAERAGARLAKGQEIAEARHPLLHHRQVLLQNGSRARVELFAILRLHRDSRHGIGDLVGADGDVVVLAPAIRDNILRSGDPADPHTRNTVGFRKAASHNHAIAHAPETRRAIVVDF